MIEDIKSIKITFDNKCDNYIIKGENLSEIDIKIFKSLPPYFDILQINYVKNDDKYIIYSCESLKTPKRSLTHSELYDLIYHSYGYSDYFEIFS